MRETDRRPIERWLDRGETVQLMPLRFCARFPGTDSWGNRAVWRNGRAAWWVRNNGKVSNKRKREPVIRDHPTEHEDEEERREVKNYSTTEDEDEEEGKLKREAEEENVKVKQEPTSPPPLRR